MIVVCLLGCSGSGKTALATAMAEGSTHLVARYPGTWHFPPLWVQRVANGEGFRLASMHLGPYMAEQRLIWRLERIA